MMVKIKILTEYIFDSDLLSIKANKLMLHGGLNSTHSMEGSDLVITLWDDEDELLGKGIGRAIGGWEWEIEHNDDV